MSKQKKGKDKKDPKDEIQERSSSGRFDFPDKSFYIGEYKILVTGEKIREGKGRLEHPSTEKSGIGVEYYEGNWENDMMSGQGTYHYSNGDIYTGEWRENLQNGMGKYQCIDGTFYEGEFLNHKMHGTGIYWDIDGIAWTGEFREGFYSSKDQPRLKEEKRLILKEEQMKNIPQNVFYSQWQDIISTCDKKTWKEKLGIFFTSQESMGMYIREPYPKIDEKPSYDKWNDSMKFLFSNDPIVNVIVNDSKYTFFESDRVLVSQFQEDLSSGQVIEISAQLNEKRAYMGIAYLEQLKQWVIVHFKEETVKKSKN